MSGEARASRALRARLPQALRLYVVTDADLARGRSDEEVVSLAISGGATAIQFRAKGWEAKRMVEVGMALHKITADRGVLYIVNDRVDVATAVDADGVHLGQDDFPVPLARRLLGPDKIVGLTVHNASQAAEAEDLGADYLGTSAVFPTDTKRYATVDPLGLAGLERIVRATRLPVVAIGGISRSNAAEVMATGVAGIAVVSAVVAADDIEGAARGLRSVVDEALERRSS
ncbi:MAG: thiamine phosphate synthase [Bacillota bacterium]